MLTPKRGGGMPYNPPRSRGHAPLFSKHQKAAKLRRIIKKENRNGKNDYWIGNLAFLTSVSTLQPVIVASYCDEHGRRSARWLEG